MYAPIACQCTRPHASAPSGCLSVNLLREAVNSHQEDSNGPDQPPVTRSELGLYTISGVLAVLFSQVRSHWWSEGTADTEINPLIGLPNQHIVGLTYVP